MTKESELRSFAGIARVVCVVLTLASVFAGRPAIAIQVVDPGLGTSAGMSESVGHESISGASDEPHTTLERPARTAWAERVLALSRKIDEGLAGPEEADALYRELATALWKQHGEVAKALRARAPDALERRAALTQNYAARLRLF